MRVDVEEVEERDQRPDVADLGLDPRLNVDVQRLLQVHHGASVGEGDLVTSAGKSARQVVDDVAAEEDEELAEGVAASQREELALRHGGAARDGAPAAPKTHVNHTFPNP